MMEQGKNGWNLKSNKVIGNGKNPFPFLFIYPWYNIRKINLRDNWYNIRNVT